MADALRVEGDAGLAAGLKKAQRDQDRAKAAANRKVGQFARSELRAAAGRGTDRQAKMAGGIGSSAGRDAVKITVKNTARAPGAQATFYGAKRTTGWNRSETPNHPPWVGDDWTVFSRTGGPYVVNATLAEIQPAVEDRYLTEHAEALFRAVPAKPKG